MFTASTGTPRLLPKDRTLPYLLNPSPDDPMFKRKPQSFRAELHRRFTEWVYPIVFALIALAVIGNARSHRESRINPLVTAVTIALIVRWAGYFAANQVQVAPALWPVVYLIPLAFVGDLDLVHRHQPDHGTAGGAGRPADLGACASSATA